MGVWNFVRQQGQTSLTWGFPCDSALGWVTKDSTDSVTLESPEIDTKLFGSPRQTQVTLSTWRVKCRHLKGKDRGVFNVHDVTDFKGPERVVSYIGRWHRGESETRSGKTPNTGYASTRRHLGRRNRISRTTTTARPQSQRGHWDSSSYYSGETSL